MKNKLIIFWAYAGEIILVFLLIILLVLGLGLNDIAIIVIKNWSIFSTIAGILFAAGIALFIFMAQMFSSEFGNYLNIKKADNKYLKACVFQVFLFLMAALLPLFAYLQHSEIVAYISLFVLLYALINGFTVVINTFSLIILNQRFQRDLIEFRRDQGK